jgi:hypothetical protein
VGKKKLLGTINDVRPWMYGPRMTIDDSSKSD